MAITQDSGTYVGNGATASVTTGFAPEFIRLRRSTDDGSCAVWHSTMNDGEIVDILGTENLITGTGITPTVDGFEVGADAKWNENGVSYDYQAESADE